MRCFIVLFLALLVLLTKRAFAETSAYAPDYLILVNKTHLFDPSYTTTINLVEVKAVDGTIHQLEKTTYNAFGALKTVLEEKGVVIGIDSAYRTIQRQQEIMDAFMENYGEEYARATVAISGTSEHHTGLALDIVPMIDGTWVLENEDLLAQKEVFKVIHETLPACGFILRYPSDKTNITGYSYEPWHIRYVGPEAAKEIYARSICLEEYLMAQEE